MKKWLIFIGIAVTLSGCTTVQTETGVENTAVEVMAPVESAVETETADSLEIPEEKTENLPQEEPEQEKEPKTQMPAENAKETEKETADETQAQAEAEAEAQAQAEAEAAAQAEAQAQAEAEAQAQDGAVTEVSRTYIEDCGMDSGYWEVLYSDGHVEYIDD